MTDREILAYFILTLASITTANVCGMVLWALAH